ncbi:dihydrofolate reductase [Actinocrinis puniceicyclus]|uniref:Dihydrofolate reductase n=1 Tax=Actinocrinis puniceicyclus TaxID=977794 RepID=A0A8J8BD57_9ACTN|nr:NAD(P)-dependent oxidoreductase [Actinocrinis puniceicyclus]MBS2963741.1 dihydrofolate reductase [Actinocrinis puniceicyclus]
MDERRLVWTAPGTLADLNDLPRDARAQLEIVEIPADPLADQRLAEVRVLIPPLVRNQADDGYDLKTLIASASRLDLVQALTSGVDWIVDLIPAEVTLCSVRGAYDDLMAELMLAGILAVYKEIPHHAAAQARGRWEPRQVRVLGGSRVLFVGYGSIAQCLEKYLLPFGVEVRRVARRPREGVDGISELSVLLPGADIVVVLTPLTAQTQGLIDEEFLTLMKPGALLVNGARGLVADTEALIAAAERGKVRAYLDVTDPEPLPDGHALWSAPGVFITPHIGSLVPENRERAFAVVRENLISWARGETLRNVVAGDY